MGGEGLGEMGGLLGSFFSFTAPAVEVGGFRGCSVSWSLTLFIFFRA